jgi:type II secretory ATPase GspE/PulE/Tfp pilus assembly ATPase PilB-like protein
LPHGIVLVTGPTGSVTTTTLYSSLLEIKGPQIKIITTEDPVEYQLEGINQIQIQPRIGLTFGNSLRAMLIILEEYTPDTINNAEMPTGVPLVFEFENGEKRENYFLQDAA